MRAVSGVKRARDERERVREREREREGKGEGETETERERCAVEQDGSLWLKPFLRARLDKRNINGRMSN